MPARWCLRYHADEGSLSLPCQRKSPISMRQRMHRAMNVRSSSTRLAVGVSLMKENRAGEARSRLAGVIGAAELTLDINSTAKGMPGDLDW